MQFLKQMLSITLLLATGLLCLTARGTQECSNTLKPTIEKRILEARVGQECSIRVHETPSSGTGWFWLVTDTSKDNPVQLVRKDKINSPTPVSGKGAVLVGGGYDVDWVFSATKAGTYTITLINKHVWADPEIYGYIQTTVTVN